MGVNDTNAGSVFDALWGKRLRSAPSKLPTLRVGTEVRVRIPLRPFSKTPKNSLETFQIAAAIPSDPPTYHVVDHAGHMINKPVCI